MFIVVGGDHDGVVLEPGLVKEGWLIVRVRVVGVDDVNDSGLEIRRVVSGGNSDTNGPVLQLSLSPVGSLVLKHDSIVEVSDIIKSSQVIESLQVSMSEFGRVSDGSVLSCIPGGGETLPAIEELSDR